MACTVLIIGVQRGDVSFEPKADLQIYIPRKQNHSAPS